MGRKFLGEFEQIVMLALARCDDDAYAATVHDEIRARTGRSVSIPAVYVTLSRLEEKGLVVSWLGEPSPHPGGRAKRYFELSEAGDAALRRSWNAISRLAEGLGLGPE